MFKTLERFKYIFLFVVIVQISVIVFAHFTLRLEPTQMLTIIVFVALNLGVLLLFDMIIGNEAKKNFISTKWSLSFDAYETFNFAETGLISYDEHYFISWVSEFLASRGFNNLIGKKIFDWKPDLKLLWNKPESNIKLKLHGRTYKVKFIKETRSFIFKDITQYETLLNTYTEEGKVMGLMSIDNYQEVFKIADEDLKIKITSILGDIITEFSQKFKALIRSSGPDSYIVLMDYKAFYVAKENDFEIFSSLSKRVEKLKVNLSISVGFSFGHASIPHLIDLASSALELATARGGDQIVIRGFGKPTEFIGGQSEAKFKTSRVKIRNFAKTVGYEIKSARNVIVCGHKFGDFDAIGSGLGAVSLVNSMKNEDGQPIDVKWVCDIKTLDKKARESVEQIIPKDFLDKHHVTPQDSLRYVDSETLVIVVDTHIQSRIEQPKLVDGTRKVIVIDHHRRSEEDIKDVVDSYIEPSASSTSEIMTEIINYQEDEISKPQFITNLMLTGIVLDTNFYRMRTATRTFEASALLKNWGADPVIADSLMKDSMQDMQMKSLIMGSMEEVIEGLIIATAPETMKIQGSELAQVAQQLLQIKGTRCAIVIGKNIHDQIAVSFRSDGSMNVQVLAEELGGGGHFTASGAQVDNSDIEDVRDNITNLIRTGKADLSTDKIL